MSPNYADDMAGVNVGDGDDNQPAPPPPVDDEYKDDYYNYVLDEDNDIPPIQIPGVISGVQDPVEPVEITGVGDQPKPVENPAVDIQVEDVSDDDEVEHVDNGMVVNHNYAL